MYKPELDDEFDKKIAKAIALLSVLCTGLFLSLVLLITKTIKF